MPDAVDEGGAWILASILLEAILGDHGGRRVDGEVHAVAASSDAQVRHLRQEIAEVIRSAGGAAAAIAVPDRAGVGQIEPREVARQEHFDHLGRRALHIEKRKSHNVFCRVARSEWFQLRLGAGEVEGERVIGRCGAGSRALADAQQEHDLITNARRRCVEHRDHLEAGQRRRHIHRGEQRIFLETPAEVTLADRSSHRRRTAGA